MSNTLQVCRSEGRQGGIGVWVGMGAVGVTLGAGVAVGVGVVVGRGVAVAACCDGGFAIDAGLELQEHNTKSKVHRTNDRNRIRICIVFLPPPT
jgi:hypothetical protein